MKAYCKNCGNIIIGHCYTEDYLTMEGCKMYPNKIESWEIKELLDNNNCEKYKKKWWKFWVKDK